jgi:hypothetical protein
MTTRSEKTKQSHATMDVAKVLASAASSAAVVQAVMQTACERARKLAVTEEGTRLRQETERLAQLATELGVGLATYSAAAEVQSWQLGRAGQEEERAERLAAERAKLIDGK